METWTYQRNGAIEGPVTAEQLKSLYDAGEITLQTLIRSSSAGGGWRLYGEVARLAPSRIPRAVKKLWPFFVFGAPLVGGLIDAFLIRSTGNAFVESNISWLSHVPTALNLLAVALWLLLISIEVQKKDQQRKVAGMAVWLIAAPLYLTFSWWTTVLVSGLVNAPFGFRVPECQADITKAQVKDTFEKIAAKQGDAGASAIALTDEHQEWGAGRMRMCTGKLATTNGRTYSVRYEIEDHGNRLFLRRMHGFNITMLVN